MEIVFIVFVIVLWYFISLAIKESKQNDRMVNYRKALDILEEIEIYRRMMFPEQFTEMKDDCTIYWKGEKLSNLTSEEMKEFREFTGLNIKQKGEK